MEGTTLTLEETVRLHGEYLDAQNDRIRDLEEAMDRVLGWRDETPATVENTGPVGPEQYFAKLGDQ